MKRFEVKSRIITREELYAKKTGAKLPAPAPAPAPAAAPLPVIELPTTPPAPEPVPAPVPEKTDNIQQEDNDEEPLIAPEPIKPALEPASPPPKPPAQKPPSVFSFGSEAAPAREDPEKPATNITRTIGGVVLALSIFALAGARQ